MVDTLDNVMDVTTDDLNRIFGKHVDSEDDFEVDPPQMAVDNAPDEYDLMEDELKYFIMEQRNKNTTKKTDLCVKKFKEWLVLTHKSSTQTWRNSSRNCSIRTSGGSFRA